MTSYWRPRTVAQKARALATRRVWYARNKLRVLTKINAYYQAHRAERLAYMARYRKENREVIRRWRMSPAAKAAARVRMAQWRHDNIEKRRAYEKRRYLLHRGHIRRMRRAWYAKNRVAINAYRRKNHKLRRAGRDPLPMGYEKRLAEARAARIAHEAKHGGERVMQPPELSRRQAS